MIDLPIEPQKTFAEFFAGIGLMRVGLEREGWKIAFANETSVKRATEMYAAHFEDADDHFFVEDIHKLSMRRKFRLSHWQCIASRNDLCSQARALG